MRVKVAAAIVLLMIVIPIIILGGIYYTVGVGILAVLAYKEFIDLEKGKDKTPDIVSVVGLICLLFIVYSNYVSNYLITNIEYWALGILMLVLLLPIVFVGNQKKYNSNKAFYLIGVILLLGFAFNTLLVVRNYDVKYLVFILLITVLTDTFAQIVGTLIGKTKLTSISPNKTWEGSIFGVLIGSFISIMYYIAFINPDANIVRIIILVVFLAAVAQIGDLIFSSIKRLHDKKDFSNIIPGHGGILDRLDSLIMVLLAFALVIQYL